MSFLKDKKNLYLVITLALLFFALIAIIGGIGMATVNASAPEWDSKELEVDATTFIYDKDGDLLARLHGVENRMPVTINDIPEHVQQAFISIEDARFYDHRGVDLRAITRAAVANIRSNRVVEGASTITQQLVKNSFLTPEKSFNRKIQEAFLAFELEKNYTKDEILEFYLNQVYFGHGAYGVQAASKLYFNKKVEDLTVGEGALLAGLIQAPNNYSPYNELERAEARMKVVLSRMEDQEYINSYQASLTLKEGLDLAEREETSDWNHPYFIDYVINYIVENHNITEGQIFRGGFEIHTTLDPKTQKTAEEALSDEQNFPIGTEEQQVQGAMTILDYRTGEIKALVGGREHEAKRGYNRATSLKRQPGSTFKPIAAFGPALELKYPTNLVLNDSATTFEGGYSPRNSNGRFSGPITMRTALSNSVNVYSVKLLDLIGIDEGFEFAQKLGFDLDARDKVLPMALGGITYGTSPLEMARGYGVFANDGVLVDSTPLSQIIDNEGRVVVDAVPKKSKVMSSQAAYLMTDMLVTAVTNGTGTRARMNRPVAGKTGTVELPDVSEFKGISGGIKDAWFVGYTPELVAAVWMGYDKTNSEHYLRGVYGGNEPAQLWKKIMEEVLKDEPVKQFEKPDEKFEYKSGVNTTIPKTEAEKKKEEEKKKAEEEEEKKRLEEEKKAEEEEEKKRLEEEDEDEDEDDDDDDDGGSDSNGNENENENGNGAGEGNGNGGSEDDDEEKKEDDSDESDESDESEPDDKRKEGDEKEKKTES